MSRTQPQAKRETIVGRVEEIPPGSVRIVPVGKFGVGVFNVDGQYYALNNYCPHRGAPVCRGYRVGLSVPGDEPYSVQWIRDGEFLRCPWHGWEWEIATGRSATYPGKAVRAYRVRVEDGLVILEGVA